MPLVESNGQLLRQLAALSVPVLVEHMLHMGVGLVDVWIANHLPRAEDQLPGAAAVGTIAYFLWFIGLLVGAVGTGSTALIARAKGARHRSLANGVCGQSVTAALIMGIVCGALLFLFSDPLATLTGLKGAAREFALTYLRVLSFSLPFSMVMFVANSCLRGAGDTLTPALSMAIVDGTNILLAMGLTYGIGPLPQMGFAGIALGTALAYGVGGVLQFCVLLRGRGGVQLHLHRMRPHWSMLGRVLRIGIPAGVEGLIAWVANFAIVLVINKMDRTNISPAAHINTIRIESISYLTGYAIAMAAAALVGQSLGMRNPARARRCAFLAYAVGAGVMTLCGIIFIFFGEVLARWISKRPELIPLTTQCLFIAGFAQAAFAAAIIFGGALRGAGDTVAVMALNLASVLFIRFVGVMIVGLYFQRGLAAIWIVLCVELGVRGALVAGRFLQGGWRHVRV